MTAVVSDDMSLVEDDATRREPLSARCGGICRWRTDGDVDSARYAPSPAFIGFR